MLKKTLIGNWKMHGAASENTERFTEFNKVIEIHNDVEVAVCIPSIYLAQAQAELSKSSLKYGAQDVSMFQYGAHTGDLSAAMLSEFGVSYVIVGHSERRGRYGETDEQAARKALAAIRTSITPIYCIGETGEDRKLNLSKAIVEKQLQVALAILGDDTSKVVFAYEPIWAIGTGNAASLEDIEAMHQWIRQTICEISAAYKNIKVLYGGSLNSENAGTILALPGVDGGLVGGASLDKGIFTKMIETASKLAEKSPLSKAS